MNNDSVGNTIFIAGVFINMLSCSLPSRLNNATICIYYIRVSFLMASAWYALAKLIEAFDF